MKTKSHYNAAYICNSGQGFDFISGSGNVITGHCQGYLACKDVSFPDQIVRFRIQTKGNISESGIFASFFPSCGDGKLRVEELIILNMGKCKGSE